MPVTYSPLSGPTRRDCPMKAVQRYPPVRNEKIGVYRNSAEAQRQPWVPSSHSRRCFCCRSNYSRQPPEIPALTQSLSFSYVNPKIADRCNFSITRISHHTFIRWLGDCSHKCQQYRRQTLMQKTYRNFEKSNKYSNLVDDYQDEKWVTTSAPGIV